MLAEDDDEEALTTLADLAGGRGGKGEGLQRGEEVDDHCEDDILIQEDSLEEKEEEKEDAEEQDQDYTGPAVIEYEHDVAMPKLMTGEQFEAAMETQFLRPHRVSMQARKTVLRERGREGDDAADNDALVLFALLRPHPTRWWALDAAQANFFLTEQELISMHDAVEPIAKKGHIFIEGSSSEADNFRLRSGGLQGPLFGEVELLETAIAKYGRSGFLRRRLEADELLTNVRRASPLLPPSLPQRLARARQTFWASRKNIAYSPSAPVNIQNEGGRVGGREGRTRWWTIPAALAGFKLNWVDLKNVPLRRYVVPMEEGGEEAEGRREGGAAFDFGMLVEESAVVALAKKLQKGRYNEYRKKARKRGLWVEWVRGRYQEAVEERMEGGEGDEWLVDCVEGCAFGWHQTTTDTYNASRSVSSVSDLVGVKWVTRAMAQEVFNLSTAELALLPRLPGLDPTHTGVAGDLFNERDLQVLSNACVMHGWPFALRRKGLETKALQEVAWKTVERREGLREEAEDGEEEGEEEEGEGFVRVMLGMEEGEGEDRGEEGMRMRRNFLQRVVGKYGGVEGFLRYRVKVECAMEELEEEKRVLQELQEAATELKDKNENEEEEEQEEKEEEEVFVKAPGPLRDLLPASKAQTRWFSGTAAEATFFLPSHLLPTAPPPHMVRVQQGCVYHREDLLRQHVQYLMGAKGFQKRRLAVVSRLEEEMCEELLLRERKTKDKKKKNGGVELRGGARDGRGGVVDSKQKEEESVLYRRLHVLKSLASGQYFEAGGHIGLVGWRGKEGWRQEQRRQQEPLQQQQQNEHQRRTALALGARRVIHNLVISRHFGRRKTSSLLFCGVHAPFPSAASSSATTTTSSSAVAQCISLSPSSFSSSTNTVIDGLAEVLVLPELEQLISNISPPAAQEVIRQAVACCALVKYNERQAAALLPPVRRRTEERKRKKSAKQRQLQQEDEEESTEKGVPTAMEMMPWPLAIPLQVEWLEPGPVCLAVREVIVPLVSMLKSLLIQGNVAISPPTAAAAAAAAGRGDSSGSNRNSSSSSSSVICLPGGVHVEGPEITSPIFVAAHPLLVQELLAVLSSQVSRKALAEELHGKPLPPLSADACDPTGGSVAASATRAPPAKVALENLLSSLESMAVPRAHALNRRLVTSNPLIATTRSSSSSNNSSSTGTKPAIEWCLSLYDKRKTADPSLRDQQRLDCASSHACMESTICHVCTLCVAQHCGCDLSSGAAPNQLAPRVVKERAFFKAMLLVQQQKQEQEQEQLKQGKKSMSRKDGGETRKKEEGDDEQPLPVSLFRGLRREEELRLGWESHTLNRTSQAVIEDAVDREGNEGSFTPRLPAHELLVYLKEAAAEKMRMTIGGYVGGRRTTTTVADAGAGCGASGQQQQQRQKLDDHRSDPYFVLGQLDESALVALGVVVEEALVGMVEGMLQQAAVRSWQGSYRGLREETPADVKQTLRAQLGRRCSEGGEMTREAVAKAEAREEQERNVLWAVFGRTRREKVKGKRKRTEEGEERPEEGL